MEEFWVFSESSFLKLLQTSWANEEICSTAGEELPHLNKEDRNMNSPCFCYCLIHRSFSPKHKEEATQATRWCSASLCPLTARRLQVWFLGLRSLCELSLSRFPQKHTCEVNWKLRIEYCVCVCVKGCFRTMNLSSVRMSPCLHLMPPGRSKVRPPQPRCSGLSEYWKWVNGWLR